MTEIKLAKINPEKVTEEIIYFLSRKVNEMGKEGIVIGVSGGVDSAVCSILSKRAMDQEGMKMYGVVLPGSSSPDVDQDNNDAADLCHQNDIVYIVAPLENLIMSTSSTISILGSTLNKVARGNMSSRIRSNILHTVAECENCLVCGTGNRDEDFGVGYYTLFGDGAVHMSPIGGLPKRLVYQMAEYLGVPQSIIDKKPSPRLEEGQTDEGDLGYGYDVVEVFSEGLLQELDGITVMNALAHYSYDKNKFRTVKDLFIDLSRRNVIAQSKAQLVSPDVARITLSYDD